ncbi:MAG: NAD(P)H-dependent oxidoreductase [Bacteroidales bacterium]|nr:NAD(P)H-dependent oxidoreductase [Bacteroidales bacterium]
MRKLFLLLTSMLMALGLTACTSKKESTMQDNKGKKVLIAYFSWSGNTEKVAKYIAEKTNADMFRIERVTPYSKEYEPCTQEALQEKNNNERPAIKGKVKNFDDYDVILVGVPCWWYTAPMPVFTFLEKEGYNFEGKQVAFFCTYYTAEYETLNDMVKTTPKAKHLKNFGTKDDHTDGVDKWLKEIGL